MDFHRLRASGLSQAAGGSIGFYGVAGCGRPGHGQLPRQRLTVVAEVKGAAALGFGEVCRESSFPNQGASGGASGQSP